jgi:hypothetical protein
MIPKAELRNKPLLEQWISDAVAIGDILEIGEKWNNKTAFQLFALNPATVYDFEGTYNNSILTFKDIYDIQIGATTIDDKSKNGKMGI